ncbi:hypothetical protein ASE86_05115 [Sphingomonas sp. Leaf33]|nr:hypothetical protein ASE86_05115 [Sphingomonas sp. Leaf33]
MRRLFHVRPGLACAIVALALAMKLLVPAGFMPTVSHGRIVVSICSGTGPMTMVVEMPGMAHHAPTDAPKHDEGASAPCAYAGLMAPSLAATDPLLLAIALLVAMAMALRPVALPLVPAPARLRPPLRGPPRPA